MSRPPRRFFRKAIKGQHDAPRTITLDGYAASHRAVRELKADGLLPAETKLRSSKSLNNLIEQDHRGVKQRIATMLGFKGFATRGDYDRRYRIDASHPQGTIRTGASGCPRSTCACSVECRAPSLKSRQYNTGRFPAPAICTRARPTSMRNQAPPLSECDRPGFLPRLSCELLFSRGHTVQRRKVAEKLTEPPRILLTRNLA